MSQHIHFSNIFPSKNEKADTDSLSLNPEESFLRLKDEYKGTGEFIRNLLKDENPEEVIDATDTFDVVEYL